MKNKQHKTNQAKQPEQLRLRSSVYPDGWGTESPEQYNAIWNHIFSESDRAVKDPRHTKSMVPSMN